MKGILDVYEGEGVNQLVQFVDTEGGGGGMGHRIRKNVDVIYELLFNFLDSLSVYSFAVNFGISVW